MPIHDWCRVDAGVFHHFHNAWLDQISMALNGGVLPSDYYALTEQHAGRRIADVLTLHTGLRPAARPTPHGNGVLAVAEAPPKARRRLTASTTTGIRPKTVAIRHVSGHRIVAIVEVVSPANKDRPAHVAAFTAKIKEALEHEVSALVVNLFPPGPHDPHGMHGAVWELVDEAAPAQAAADELLCLASYVSEARLDAYVENVAVGGDLPEMPLFLDPFRYVNVPLEYSYQCAWNGMPSFWRDVLESGK